MEREKLNGRLKRKIVSSVYLEILFHGYSATGLTGLPVRNVRKTIASASVYKYVLTAFVAVAMSLLVMYAGFEGRYNRDVFPITVFIWMMLISLITSMQLSYGASGSGNIRNLLHIMPLTEREIEGIAASAMLKTIDLPIASSLAIMLLSYTVIGFYGMLSGVLALFTGFSVFLTVTSVTTRAFRNLSVSNRIGLVVRLLSTLPVIFFLAIPSLLFRLNINMSSLEMTYVPVLNLSGVMNGYGTSIIAAVLFASVMFATGVRMFRNSAVWLISPTEMRGKTGGRLKLKIRTPLASLILTDLRQVFRSPRLASLLLLPFVLVVVVVFYFYSAGSSGLKIPFTVFYSEDILPIAFVSSYIAYLLYMSELRGLAYFRLLSISKYLNTLAKSAVAFIFYTVSSCVLAAILVLAGRPQEYIVAVYTLFFPLLASVIFTAAYFQNAVKESRFGLSNPSSYIIYTLSNLAVFTIPAGAFLVAYMLFRSAETAAISIAIVSAAETALMAFMLLRSPG